MQCDDLRRKLDGQGASRDDQAAAEHLAVCQDCATTALQADRLQWLWDATSAPEPTAETWDNLWSSVTTRLAASNPAERDRSGPWRMTLRDIAAGSRRNPRAGLGRSRRAMLAGLIVSQAAAIVLALGWYFHDRPRATEPALPPGADLVIDIEEGQVPLVRFNGSKSEISDLSSFQLENGEDPWLVFLNGVESASTAVAMTE